MHKKYAKKKHLSDKMVDQPQQKNDIIFGEEDEAELTDDSGNIKIHFTDRTVADMGAFTSDMEV